MDGAVMLDAALGRVQVALIDALPWLDAAFGRAQKIIRTVGEKRYTVPAVYCGDWPGRAGKNDYIEVSPDAKIGNFTFFEVSDPVTIEPDRYVSRYSAPVSLILWVDLRTIEEGRIARNTEQLKAEVMRVLNSPEAGRLTINRAYARAENIYRGYSLDEVDNQFLIHPYWGVRFEGTIEYEEPCREEG